ncbi:mRNA splicing protein prp28, partial [Coemansia spiralis]
FGRVLETYGVAARDIMTRFDEELGLLIDNAQGKEFLDIQEKYSSEAPKSDGPKVFLATEEAARGLDLPDTSLVLILDIPKSVASYAHFLAP